MTEPSHAPRKQPGQAQSLPLWRLLQASAQVVGAVRSGASASAALSALDAPVRPGAQALSLAALRNLGRAQALRKLLARRPPPAQADDLLCTALALCWHAVDAPYDSFTLVDQAVECAKKNPETRGQANFINACLRRFLRERDALVQASDKDPVAVWNHPAWWIQRLQRDHPVHWQAILKASNTQAPMTLRVNPRKVQRAQYLTLLETQGVQAFAAGEHAVVLAQARPVHEVPGFEQGWVSVQDGAAQLAAPLLLQGLNTQAPLSILDACAAPGGKTAHLLELCNAQVTALEIDAARCERIHETLARLDLKARVLAADAAQPATWWDGQAFDAILLDAPCTASGIVRRHPDVRWLRRESDIAQLAAQQARLLTALWPLLKPSGRLLYCTCSVFLQEGQVQAETFLAHNTDAVSLPAPGHLLPQSGAKDNAVQDNLNSDHDGFYYMLLEKRAGGAKAAKAL